MLSQTLEFIMAAGNQKEEIGKRSIQSVVRAQLKDAAVAQVMAPPRSRNVVAVGCKLPNGLHMDIRRPNEPIQRVTLKGLNSIYEGQIIRPHVLGGYAITYNVPEEFFEEWMRLNKNLPAVKNHLVFAHKEVSSVQDMANERQNIKNGFDPIDPKKPARGIQPDDGHDTSIDE